MQTDPPIAGLVHAIQLAVAPVFLLSGIAALLNVLTSGLARRVAASLPRPPSDGHAHPASCRRTGPRPRLA